MRELDCETTDSTYASLEIILGISRADLDSVFNCLDLEDLYRSNLRHHVPPEDLLLSEVRKIAKLPGVYDRTCWFHVTRTLPSNIFEQGILPLGQNIDAIWDFLYTLAKRAVTLEEWNIFRKNMGSHHHAGLYGMKVGKALHWGPYALLIRDHAFKSDEIGNHDFFDAPEIIEDICICFSERYGYDLLKAFKRKARPCIVKFYHGPRAGCVSSALYHLYQVYHGNRCSMQCNDCFDGKGVAVPREQILKIEFPVYRKKPRRKRRVADMSELGKIIPKDLWDSI